MAAGYLWGRQSWRRAGVLAGFRPASHLLILRPPPTLLLPLLLRARTRTRPLIRRLLQLDHVHPLIEITQQPTAEIIRAHPEEVRRHVRVSVPLTWQELSPRTTSAHYNVRNIGKRLASLKRDPWAALASTKQSLGGPMEKVKTL